MARDFGAVTRALAIGCRPRRGLFGSDYLRRRLWLYGRRPGDEGRSPTYLAGFSSMFVH